MIDSSMFSFAYVRNTFRQLSQKKKPAMALQKGKLIHYLKGRGWCTINNLKVFYGICFLVLPSGQTWFKESLLFGLL